MAIFKDPRNAEKMFREFWRRLLTEFSLAREFRENQLSILFIVDEPEMAMYVDGNDLLFGSEARNRKAVVTMKMNGEMVHRYWLDKVNIPMALTMRQIEVSGPVEKVVKLLPLLKPGKQIYPEYCARYGLSTELPNRTDH